MQLVVTNGDHAAEKLRAADIQGTILPWRDVLHDGPVPRMEGLEALSYLRSRYIADSFGLAPDEVRRDFLMRDATILGHAAFDRIELWLEHDLYDQLQLIQVLALLDGDGRRGDVWLVQSDDYLGTLDTDDLRRRGDAAEPVTDAQFALARRAWSAFTAPTPHAMAALAEERTSVLPFLAPALRRLLAEFPDPTRGVSLTEERVLLRLARAPATVNELYRGVVQAEEARFMGDFSFFQRMDRLAFAPEPLVAGIGKPFSTHGTGGDHARAGYANACVHLTEAGTRVLMGRMDHAVANGADHWIGGVHITAGAMIRYDRAAAQVVAQP